MYTVPHILMSANITYEDSPAVARTEESFSRRPTNWWGNCMPNLRRFQTSNPAYFGWDAHHIVEAQDLARLGVQQRFPPYEHQVCVLLPKTAHAKRINSIFRAQNPTNLQVTANDLKCAYRDAYWLIGDYCGGGEGAIRDELVNVVLAMFRSASLDTSPQGRERIGRRAESWAGDRDGDRQRIPWAGAGDRIPK